MAKIEVGDDWKPSVVRDMIPIAILIKTLIMLFENKHFKLTDPLLI